MDHPSHPGLAARLVLITCCCVTNSPRLGDPKQSPLHYPREFWVIRARCSSDACLLSELFEPQLGRPEQLGMEPSGAFPSRVWHSDWGDSQVWLGWDICMGTVAWGSPISCELRMSKQRATWSLMCQKSPGIISILLLQVVTSLLVCEERA